MKRSILTVSLICATMSASAAEVAPTNVKFTDGAIAESLTGVAARLVTAWPATRLPT